MKKKSKKKPPTSKGNDHRGSTYQKAQSNTKAGSAEKAAPRTGSQGKGGKY